MAATKPKICIIGSGLIGRSWSMLFAGAGYSVCLYDISAELVKVALESVRQQLQQLEQAGTLRGSLSAQQQQALITGCTELEGCLAGCRYVQECVPEQLDLKREVFKQLDSLVGPETILASSTSTFVPSRFSEGLTNRARVIVAHPVNPPYFVPLVEVVPAPWTEATVVQTTRSIMADIGQSPVTLSRELPGFALNRIQYVILNECWHLVNDGVLSVEDVDKVMSEGLGMRYAFLGPLETAHLNAEGMENYCDRYRESMYSVCQTMKPAPKFEGPNVSNMFEQLSSKTPVAKLNERRTWRDRCLTQLSLLKKKLSS